MLKRMLSVFLYFGCTTTSAVKTTWGSLDCQEVTPYLISSLAVIGCEISGEPQALLELTQVAGGEVIDAPTLVGELHAHDQRLKNAGEAAIFTVGAMSLAQSRGEGATIAAIAMLSTHIILGGLKYSLADLIAGFEAKSFDVPVVTSEADSAMRYAFLRVQNQRGPWTLNIRTGSDSHTIEVRGMPERIRQRANH